jgi:hypothetical protein
LQVLVVPLRPGAGMTDGLAVLAAVLLVVVCALAYRRWGWPAVAAVVSGAVAVLAIFRRRDPVIPPPPAPDLPERLREVARDRLAEAERAREAAVRLEADIDAADDAEALVDHIVRRSKGET